MINPLNIKKHISGLTFFDAIGIYTDIKVKGGQNKQIKVGHLMLGGQLTAFRPFVEEEMLVFYRTTKTWNSVFSYNEKTVSLHPNIKQFLLENNVQKILTYAEDKSIMNISSPGSYKYRSDLGIGLLWRAKHADTYDKFNSVDIDISKFEYRGSIKAEDVTLQEQKPVIKDNNTPTLF